eukprot:CAMPEP_0198308334 /NCGR_PEP_ID=MMETSP1450-20131203/1013_1 /TAXON_ID=753684 ORGANISM="Madagascaria erythrocladiodes, Strain CCMP3234" /NCGR_SAMPLE_ID=MMETSP1450 /ASSEMBLY_ACC=CAM_ASM_001115 /LENGTH=42 /DNA_ID= /DNA_START= /DNA_END= /DNA_ORIENTATION=
MVDKIINGGHLALLRSNEHRRTTVVDSLLYVSTMLDKSINGG